MKSLNRFNLVALAATLALATATAYANDRYPPEYPPEAGPVHYTDTARVLSSSPVYQQINQPTRECWREQTGYTTEPAPRSYGGAVLGAIVGGVVGHQIGGGSGKDVATAAGAAIGAVTGNNIDNNGRDLQTRPVEEERCRVVDHWTRQITGYNVIYRYQGNEYSTFMSHDPGAVLRLDVSISIANP
jgi:uncharacterized protein YcfJ